MGIHVSCQGCITSILWIHFIPTAPPPLAVSPENFAKFNEAKCQTTSIYPKDLQLKNIEFLRIKLLGLNQVGLKLESSNRLNYYPNVTHSRIISYYLGWIKYFKLEFRQNYSNLIKFVSIKKVMFDTTPRTYSKPWLYPLIFWIPLDPTFFWMVNLVTHFPTKNI